LIDFRDVSHSFMDDVVSVKHVWRDGCSAEFARRVLLNGGELCWIEHDHFRMLQWIDFAQIEGLSLAGILGISDAPDGSNARLQIEFDIAIPSLSDTPNHQRSSDQGELPANVDSVVRRA
jgi:hypothetical protein